jgi:FixJ family two-component response regulator
MQGELAQPLIGVVDNQESKREAVSRLVRSAGYRTAVFESATAFLDGDHKHEVHCLVLDIDTPGLAGLELQRHLAQMNVSIPIIFLTAQEDLLSAVALPKGAGAILGKPFTGPALLSAIRSVLDFSHYSRKRK